LEAAISERASAPREDREQYLPFEPEERLGEIAVKPSEARGEKAQAYEARVHPVVTKIAVGAAVWFLAITWLSFAGSGETNFLLVIVVLFFALFITLFLLTVNYNRGDPRWPVRETSFRRFLKSEIAVGDSKMRGRDVLIGIALIPVALAFAATLIGLAWVILG
jgi:hypothetical protein